MVGCLFPAYCCSKKLRLIVPNIFGVCRLWGLGRPKHDLGLETLFCDTSLSIQLLFAGDTALVADSEEKLC